MITEPVLDLAVAKGLISPGQALALKSLARQEQPTPIAPAEPIDEERLRLVSGFADVFVTLGLVLFLGSAAYLADRAAIGGGWVAGVVAAAAWALAEFFTRVRRMALPSIVLLVTFATASFVALSTVFGASGGRSPTHLGWLDTWLNLGGGGAGGATAALAAALLVGLHYARFRVPIAVAAAAGCGALAAVLAFTSVAPDLATRFINAILLATGLAAFALAMRFDLADPGRRTRSADIAFWLHLLAAPLIVHSVFTAVGANRGEVGPLAALGILAIFVALAIVAILVDRRALLVSGLIYAGVAFSSLIRQAGAEGRLVVPVTLLVLGALVLMLSAGWRPLRETILRRLSPGLAARLPHPASS